MTKNQIWGPKIRKAKTILHYFVVASLNNVSIMLVED